MEAAGEDDLGPVVRKNNSFLLVKFSFCFYLRPKDDRSCSAPCGGGGWVLLGGGGRTFIMGGPMSC